MDEISRTLNSARSLGVIAKPSCEHELTNSIEEPSWPFGAIGCTVVRELRATMTSSPHRKRHCWC